MKVHVFLAHFDDAIGYDLEINDDKASVQDYLDALNQFQENHVDACKGCDGCCYERIPLTSIDVHRYLEDPEILKALCDCPTPLSSFIKNFCHVKAQGPVIDISLKRNPDLSCLFLDRTEKICRNHLSRSFVCQSFVCLPHSEKAGQLRDILLNSGEDDLVHRYLLEAEKKGEFLVIHENNNASPSLKDYPENVFTGKTHYREIYIKDVLPKALWQELYIHPSF